MGLSRTTKQARRKGKRVLRVAPRPSWKLLGLAGIAGVAATGVVVARNRRARADVTPDELRERLHERLAQARGEVAEAEEVAGPAPAPEPASDAEPPAEPGPPAPPA